MIASTEDFSKDQDPAKDADPDKTKKPRGKRKPLPEDLPRVEKILDLTDAEKRCPIHEVDLVKIGEQHNEKLEIEPAMAYIEDTIPYRYKCPCCDDLKVISAPRRPDPIPKSFASAGLLASYQRTLSIRISRSKQWPLVSKSMGYLPM